MQRNFKGLIKLASPWLRRIRGMSSAQRSRIPITENLLSLISDDSGTFYRAPRPLLEAYRENGLKGAREAARSNVRYHYSPYFSVDNLNTLRKNFPEHKFETLEDLVRLTGASEPGWEKHLGDMRRYIEKKKKLTHQLKDATKSLDALKSQIASEEGPLLTFKELKARYPEDKYFFKGDNSTFNPENWGIDSAGFKSGRYDTALRYALEYPDSPNMRPDPSLFISPRSSSKSYRTGKSILTDHLLRIKNREIRDAIKSGISKGNNFEIVLPGHEVRGMPTERYDLIGSKKQLSDYLTNSRYGFTPDNFGIKFKRKMLGAERKLQAATNNQSELKTRLDNLYKPEFVHVGYEYSGSPFWTRGSLNNVLEYFGRKI